MIPLMLIVAVAVVLFYVVVFQLDIPGLWKFMIIFAEMALVSRLLIKRYKLPSELGLILVKSKRGVEVIDSLAKHEKIFNFMADAGVVLAYGLLSLKLMRKHVTLPTAITGLAALVILSVFVAPVALGFLMYVAGIGAASKGGAMSGGIEYALFVGGLLLLGGLFMLILFGIVFYGLVILNAIFTTLFMGSDALTNTAPGGDILLPGVNLPFFEGILALAIVLIVHEGAHAILTRIAKIKLLSSGIVLFGIIPVGAFIEPDEKRLERTDPVKHTRVLVAGPTGNMVAAMGLFAIFLVFFLATSDFRENALLTTSGLQQGTLIYEMDGESVGSIDFSTLSLPANENVTLLTSRGEIVKETNENGKLGIEFYVLDKNSFFTRYSNPFLQFIHVVLGLGIALNFIVGVVNILPIPLFDGYRIVDVNVRNKMIVKALSYATLGFFILNFVPRLFQ